MRLRVRNTNGLLGAVSTAQGEDYMGTRESVRVRVRNSSGLLSPSPSQARVVKSTVVTEHANTPFRLDELRDVVEGSPSDGDTLVYDQGTDTYVVQPIVIDGGTF